jgi:hypothetical protein
MVMMCAFALGCAANRRAVDAQSCDGALCDADSACSFGQCALKSNLQPAKGALPTALAGLCAAPEGPVVPTDDVNAQILGQWVLCSGSLGPADALGIEFTKDGHIYVLRAGDANGLARGVGFDYEGMWGFVNYIGESYTVGDLTLGTMRFEAIPRRMQIQTYLPNDNTAHPIVLAYANASPLPAPDLGNCSTLGMSDPVANLIDSNLIDSPDAGATFYQPFAVGRYLLCTGGGIETYSTGITNTNNRTGAPTTGGVSAPPPVPPPPAPGIELGDDGQAYALVYNDQHALVRDHPIGPWQVQAFAPYTIPGASMPLNGVPQFVLTDATGGIELMPVVFYTNPKQLMIGNTLFQAL